MPRPARRRGRRNDRYPGGFTVGDALELRRMRTATVLAGGEGLDRPVRWVHILDLPDIVPWVSAGDLVLTNSYGFQTNPSSMDQVVSRLDDKGVAGLIVGVGLFISELPRQMIEQANERSFPLIAIPWRVRFEDLTLEVVQAILGIQNALLDRVQLASQGLLEGALSNRFDHTAQMLAELLDRPVVLLDRRAQPLAASSTRFLEVAVQVEHELDEQLAVRPRPVDRSDCQDLSLRLKGACVRMQPIKVGGRLLGALLLGTARPLTPPDRLILSVASTVVALELLHLEESSRSMLERRQAFLGDLINGTAEGGVDLHDQAEVLGWPAGQSFVVAVLQVDEFHGGVRGSRTADRTLDELSRQMVDVANRNLSGCGGFVTGRSGSLTLLQEAASLEAAAKNLQPLHDAVSRLLERAQVTIGVAGPTTSLAEVQRLRAKARETVLIASKVGRIGEIVTAGELRLEELLLRLAAEGGMGLTLAPELRRVLEYDLRHRTELLRTLEVYLHTWGNVETLSRELHIHRNTARYRIKKIEELLQHSLVDPDYRFILNVATRLAHLQS